MENVGIASFYRVFLLVANDKYEILKIFCGDESLISIFNFMSKAIVSFYYSVYLPFFYQERFYHAVYGSLSLP